MEEQKVEEEKTVAYTHSLKYNIYIYVCILLNELRWFPLK